MAVGQGEALALVEHAAGVEERGELHDQPVAGDRELGEVEALLDVGDVGVAPPEPAVAVAAHRLLAAHDGQLVEGHLVPDQEHARQARRRDQPPAQLGEQRGHRQPEAVEGDVAAERGVGHLVEELGEHPLGRHVARVAVVVGQPDLVGQDRGPVVAHPLHVGVEHARARDPLQPARADLGGDDPLLELDRDVERELDPEDRLGRGAAEHVGALVLLLGLVADPEEAVGEAGAVADPALVVEELVGADPALRVDRLVVVVALGRGAGVDVEVGVAREGAAHAEDPAQAVDLVVGHVGREDVRDPAALVDHAHREQPDRGPLVGVGRDDREGQRERVVRLGERLLLGGVVVRLRHRRAAQPAQGAGGRHAPGLGPPAHHRAHHPAEDRRGPVGLDDPPVPVKGGLVGPVRRAVVVLEEEVGDGPAAGGEATPDQAGQPDAQQIRAGVPPRAGHAHRLPHGREHRRPAPVSPGGLAWFLRMAWSPEDHARPDS